MFDQSAIGCYLGASWARLQEASSIVALLTWIVLGLVSGFVASEIINGRGARLLMDIVLGIVGAVTEGWLFSTLGMASVTGLDV